MVWNIRFGAGSGVDEEPEDSDAKFLEHLNDDGKRENNITPCVGGAAAEATPRDPGAHDNDKVQDKVYSNFSRQQTYVSEFFGLGA